MANKHDMNTQPHIPRFRQTAQRPPTAPPLREMPTQAWDRPLPPSPTPPPVTGTHWLSRLLLTAVILAFLVVSATLAAVGVLIIYHADWIAPGVAVSGIDVGGQTQAAATAALQSAWQNQTILAVAGEATIPMAAADLGLAVDGAATAAFARQQGRTLASWRQFMENGRFSVSPVWQYDGGRAEIGLTELAAALALAPVEAQLVWQNGRFEALPGQPGREMDVAASLAALAGQTGAVVANGRFEPVMQVVPPAVVDLSAVAAQANTLLAGPLTIQAYDPVTDETFSRTAPPETWGSWLRVTDAAGQFDWSLDESALAAFGQAWAAEWGEGRFVDDVEMKTAVTNAITNHNPAVTLRLYHQPSQHLVQSGETLSSIGRRYGIPYPWIQQANPGLETLSAGQTITIPSPDVMIPLPVAANKRIVVNMAQQRAWVYENGALKWEWPVSTGIDSSPTAPGVFQIQSHERNAYAGNWDLWMPSFMGIYRPVPTSDFMNGFHGFPTRGGSNLLWTGDLGRPVTYGCILLSSENAQLLYDWAEDGVIVEIQS